MTAIAVTLYTFESYIPKPYPFFRLGLANIVVLFLLYCNSYKEALIVVISKTLIGGFFTGTLLSPTALMSISGSLIAFLVMVLFLKTKLKFSPIGISILGAVFHNLTQIIVVRFVLIKENEIFYLTPILILLGLLTGMIMGYLCTIMLRKM